MDSVPFEQAFDPLRALPDAVSAFRRSWPALFLGGCLMNCTEGSGGGIKQPLRIDVHDGKPDVILDLGASLGPGDPTPQLPTGPADLPADLGSWGAHALGSFHGPPLGVPLLDGMSLALILGIVAVSLLIVGVLALFRAWLWGGYLRVQQRALGELPGEPAGELRVLFGGADRLGANLRWMLLMWLIVLGATVVASLPGGAIMAVGYAKESVALQFAGLAVMGLVSTPVVLYVLPGLLLGHCYVVFDGLGAREALDRSWAMARGRRLRLWWFFIVMITIRSMAMLVGFMMCCVGMFVTAPVGRAVADTALTRAFLLATRGADAASGANPG